MGSLVFGIMLVVSGFISIIYGNNLNNNYEEQFVSFWEKGQSNPGDTWIYIGVGLLLVGIILSIYGIIQHTNTLKREERELNSTYVTKFQRKILREYHEQLENGVITKARYEELKEKLLSDQSN